MAPLLPLNPPMFEGSLTVCRAPSEAKGFEADPSFTIVDLSYLTRWFTAYMTIFCASHTDGYPYLATSFQRSVDLSGTVLRVPIPYG